MSDSTQEEAHTGPIKTPKQLLLTVFLAFVVPVFIIIALVYYVVSEHKPAGSPDTERQALGGVTAQDVERGVAERLRKVGSVEIRDANRPLKSGEDVYKAQCVTCHGAGVAGAPKLGDTAAWTSRVSTGLQALAASALKGKGAMPAQGGGDFNDTEITRAVAYMANSAGGKFVEPAAPAATAAAQGGASAAPATSSAPAAVAAAPAAAAANGEALYKQACMACHAAGVAGAPKLGDKAAWAPRVKLGTAALVQSVLKGKGAMPPKGGSAASDAELQAAVEYMVGVSR